jgi:uncharacterized protein YqgV (UPF0045/DUF77 family)
MGPAQRAGPFFEGRAPEGVHMNCSIAIQYLPMDVAGDAEVCRVVDAVIAYIDSTGLDYFVGPFETAIEGDYDACMECLKQCQLVGAKAGCGHVMTYVKIDYKTTGDVMSTEHKVSKYHEGAPEFAKKEAVA